MWPDKVYHAARLTLLRALKTSRQSRGDAEETAKLLWARSRRDTTFRNALVRVACHRLAQDCGYRTAPRPVARPGQSPRTSKPGSKPKETKMLAELKPTEQFDIALAPPIDDAVLAEIDPIVILTQRWRERRAEVDRLFQRCKEIKEPLLEELRDRENPVGDNRLDSYNRDKAKDKVRDLEEKAMLAHEAAWELIGALAEFKPKTLAGIACMIEVIIYDYTRERDPAEDDPFYRIVRSAHETMCEMCPEIGVADPDPATAARVG